MKKISVLKVWHDIFAEMKRNKEIYDMLTVEERNEVDAFNKAIHGKTIEAIVAMGTHPFLKYQEKYGS